MNNNNKSLDKCDENLKTPPDTTQHFPFDCLPDPIHRFVDEIARVKSIDPMMILMPTLGVLSGAIGNMLWDASRGKAPVNPDPRTEEGRKYLATIAIRSSVAPIMGDVGGALAEGGYAEALANFVAGPIAVSAFKGLSAVITNLDESEKIPGKLFNVARPYAPGRTLIYGNMLYERLLLDTITRLTDVDSDQYFDQKNKRAEDAGQPLLWPHGELSP